MRPLGQARLGLILAVIGLLGGIGLGLSQRQQPVLTPGAQPPVSGNGSIEVHVVGWVAAPGVVSVASGSLVIDAVVAAGGLRPGAVVEAVNLAAPLSAGQQIVVPGPEDGPTQGETGATGLVSINRASASELEALPGVGPVLAARIIAYREQHGPFSEIEDLLGVSGIGESKLASLRDLVTVQ